MKNIIFLLSLTLLFTMSSVFSQKKKSVIKTLIVDGQNNHVQWPKITFMMKQYLEETGRFKVDVERTKYTWKEMNLLKHFLLLA